MNPIAFKFLGTLALVVSLLLPLRNADAATPRAGKYSGKTGSTGRISFRVHRNQRQVGSLNVSIFAPGQDTYGNLTTWQLVASRTDGKRFRMTKSGRFRAKGLDRQGIRFDVRASYRGRGFRGKVEMSKFNLISVYNPFTGFYDTTSELVSGSRNFSAR